MIEINELRLMIPDIREEEAKYIGRLISQKLAQHLPGEIKPGSIESLDIRLPFSNRTTPEIQATIISQAILQKIKATNPVALHTAATKQQKPSVDSGHPVIQPDIKQ